MNKAPQQCEIVYVKGRAGAGWKWRAVTSAGAECSSEDVYPLFYECVVAARASGYQPLGVLAVHYQ